MYSDENKSKQHKTKRKNKPMIQFDSRKYIPGNEENQTKKHVRCEAIEPIMDCLRCSI
jgi:hypothetical protein